MGQLVNMEDLKPDPTWHLETASWNGDSRGWNANLDEDPSIAASLAIHFDHLSGFNATGKEKVEIRRWIEEHLPDTVILAIKSMDYYYHYEYEGRNKYDHHSSNKRHGYYMFHFENAGSAVLFKLHFGNIVSDITEYHPEHIGEESVRMRIPGNYGYLNGNGTQFDF